MERSTVKRSVKEANCPTSFLAYAVDMDIPGKVVADPNAEEFYRADSFNRLVIHVELHLWIGFLFGGNYHGLSLTGIGR